MKKTIIFLVCLSLFVCASFSALAKENENPVQAKSAILMCMDTGDVLYKENEYEHLSPASVTKIMTILLVLEALDSNKITLEDKVTASEEAVSMGGSQIWLEKGETMTVNELMKAVVIASANDACTALAEYVGGSTTGFVKMMNDRAAELGLENTHFENSNGLDDTVSNHYSCAYDLAVITCEVMKHTLIKDYTTIWLDSLRNGETELNNTNKLVNTYNGITGLKTGTTSNAGFCVSATAERDSLNLVAVVLGSDTSEHRFDAASYLLDWGFANYEVITPEIDNKQINSIDVNMGEIKKIKPVYKDSAKICINKSDSDITYKYEIPKEINAPVKKGDKIGEISVLNGGNIIGSIALVSPDNIAKVTLGSIFSYILLKI